MTEKDFAKMSIEELKSYKEQLSQELSKVDACLRQKIMLKNEKR